MSQIKCQGKKRDEGGTEAFLLNQTWRKFIYMLDVSLGNLFKELMNDETI